ncbi:ABC-type glycerol-3-phosphate transport system, substrate-binding protein [Fontibacillus panacisegetis]|uniref:ABC-type glycerol-3-phosphate transport system, substrate-binding protein n=1 Tax=Fontibacillus panacisegetis TaxID=670482 RepID=A0A1G7FX94_9BACL|nr:extracellular solute-binding protein [Fontibacillus panacisegetis]SDE80471.1 ABC-type glycerol-3-phosphate transport system, substrate-binding protein [Fontibacillus panacisegetis]
MRKNKVFFGFMALILVVAMMAGCSSNKNTGSTNTGANTGSNGEATEQTGKPSGEITVITQRTDIVDTVFKEYAAEFNKIYPDVKVNFQALSDFEGQITVRMNSNDYGDVLLFPSSIPLKDAADFFEPLGEFSDLSKEYIALEEKTVDGKAYGIPTAVNFSGILYNKKVFENAGVTTAPRTPDEFLNALKAIKAKDSSIVPLYTNYADSWPLTQWEGSLTTVAGNVDYVNVEQPNSDENFVPGKPHYDLYKVMYDAAKEGLIEADPTTTNWEASKADLANGKIGAMVLGSWAIVQIQGLAENPDDIAYMPFPTNASEVIMPLSGDYNLSISKQSKNKEAARAWLDWFVKESGYPTEQVGGMSPVIGAELPSSLKQFEGTDIKFELKSPAKEGQEGLVDKIDKEGEIGLNQPEFKKRIIEAAIGNTNESYDDIMKDLNDAWVKARAKVAQ